MSENLAVERWDADYTRGRYAGKPPLPYVQTVLDHLGDEGPSLPGIYIGCGNGRNYIPMLEAGLNITGIDISQVALDQLLERYPAAKNKILRRDFLQMPS